MGACGDLVVVGWADTVLYAVVIMVTVVTVVTRYVAAVI